MLVVPGIAGAQVAKWDDYLERGRAFERQRHYADAEALYITIVRDAEEMKSGDARVAWALTGLGSVYRKTGQPGRAEPAYKAALEVFEQVLGPGTPEVATALRNLASLYSDQGRLDEAAALAGRAESIESGRNRSPQFAVTGDRSDVVVNGVPLSETQVNALQRAYRTRIQGGRYWYDPVSGAWGFEGGPAAGQIMPGLSLGGRLQPDASGGHTGVFVNNRELHALDVLALQRCTPVYRGRYWVNARGVGGYQGGPPIFDLAALCRRGGNGGGSGHSWVNGDGSSSYRNDNLGLGVIIDSQGATVLGR